MEWKVTKEALTSLATDCLLVVHTQGEEALKGCTQEVDEALDHRISRLVTEGEITGKTRGSDTVHNWGKIPCQTPLGTGAGQEWRSSTWTRVKNGMAIASRKARAAGVKQLTVACSPTLNNRWNPADLVQAVVEGFELGVYRYQGYKQKQEQERALETVWLVMPGVTDSAFEAGIERGRVFAAATNTARDLTYEPANKLTPSILAERALEIANRHGIEAESFR